ncbi:hypothetical protein G3480_03680 [Thiorhodococcus mannitoliphagus]|uniref:Uncharacterized protein n=1 Tax=Thiorhodococcus mannitoliphagus TaxID=329406 RepID=A0A6P1DQJ3_9GAMM|nr:hypothetical protein [Thiorhodococcus mannitoliphagus]NEX19423.1 hypothetical protein [Thiorhodococcus mannitoliphagus]
MAAPIIVPIWLIIVVILAAAAGTGVLAYFATHSVTTILFLLGILAIIFVVVLPNLPQIMRWSKEVRTEMRNKESSDRDEKQ